MKRDTHRTGIALTAHLAHALIGGGDPEPARRTNGHADPHNEPQPPTGPTGPKDPPRTTKPPRIDPKAHKETRNNALASAMILLGLGALAFIAAPLLDATTFWQDHFPGQTSRTGLLIWLPLLLFGTLARAWRPLTWEAELLANSAKGLAHAVIAWWLLSFLLDAPRLAALAMLPFLLAAPLAALHAAKSGTRLGRRAHRALVLAPLSSMLCALALATTVWTDPQPIVLIALTLPLILVILLMLPLAVHHARRVSPHPTNTPTSTPVGASSTQTSHPLDLPPGTLHPPAGILTLVLTLGAFLLTILIIAPGVPLGAVITWAALIAALPLVTRAVMIRSGTAHPRAIAGPDTFRRHVHRVHTINDDSLHRLDDAVERFLRWGSGRKTLAQELTRILNPADPEQATRRLEHHLSGLPRSPFARRQREDALVHLLRQTGHDTTEAPA